MFSTKIAAFQRFMSNAMTYLSDNASAATDEIPKMIAWSEDAFENAPANVQNAVTQLANMNPFNAINKALELPQS